MIKQSFLKHSQICGDLENLQFQGRGQAESGKEGAPTIEITMQKEYNFVATYGLSPSHLKGKEDADYQNA